MRSPMPSLVCALAVLGLLILAGCPGEGPSSPDAAAAEDAGTTPADATTVQADAAPTIDAASVVDSGSDTGAAPDAALVPDAGSTPDAGQTGPSLDAFPSFVAERVCGALMRCCNAQSQAEFFAPFAGNTKLTAYVGRLPPKATLDQAKCEQVLEEMLGVAVFADWVRSAKAGEVLYHPEAAQACGEALEQAACGGPMERALFDSTCFAYSPPQGGVEQRRCFERTRAVGESCRMISDGLGAGFYGTCNPLTAFCCYPVTGKPPGTCGLPKDGLVGACTTASAAGETCEYGAIPLRLCRTGLHCAVGAGRCVEDLTGPLQVGEACADEQTTQLGTCVDSWCDSMGSRVCTAKKANGQACQGPDECLAGSCDWTDPKKPVCADPTFCLAP